MDLLPTEEQTEITSTIRTVLADQFPLNLLDDFAGDASVRANMWQQFGELGWFSLGLAEASGGVGYGPAEESLLFRELGRAAAPGPFLAQVIGVHLAADRGDERLSGLVAGSMIAGWAEHIADDRWLLQHHGTAGVFVANCAGGLALVDPIGFADVTTMASLDPLTPLARATMSLDAATFDARHATRTQVLLAAHLAGIAQATAEQSTEYAKVRHQFGQPVGGFQAVKHRCADMATRGEVAAAQVLWAALSLSGETTDAMAHALAARVVANQAAITNSQVNVQNHGGIGFTWEHTAHRYVTRARLDAQMAGGIRSAQHLLLAQLTPS